MLRMINNLYSASIKMKYIFFCNCWSDLANINHIAAGWSQPQICELCFWHKKDTEFKKLIKWEQVYGGGFKVGTFLALAAGGGVVSLSW